MIFQLQRVLELVDRLRSGFNHQRIAGLDHVVTRRTVKPPARAHQADDRRIRLVRLLVKLGHPFADHLGLIRNTDLGHVIL